MNIRVLAIFCATAASPAIAQDVGPSPKTFAATYVGVVGQGCQGLLITGQFLAATPGYTITLSEATEQENLPTPYALDMTATPPTGVVPQVLQPTAVVYESPDFDQCPYGIIITYEGDTFIVPFLPL
ncbi:hypothetical protein [Ruegeria sp. EL01]|jgi:hypothetical protein|uniref:hypothetical protein n=1 Tax=Ruegeria sp. EL01 TaxID=2107578 RepID=UPI000EA82BD9|nr:hypothetical protein [Ruegeria sp. EL01]